MADVGCKTCRFVVKNGNRRGPWTCAYEPPVVPLPDAITKAAGYQGRVSRTSVWSDNGKTCPVWSAS